MRVLGFIIALVFMCPSGASVYARERFKFSPFPTSVRGLVFKEILTEAYQQIGIDISVTPYPARRGLELANNGILDGEAGRLKHVAPAYPNLLIVPVPIFHNSTVAFTKRNDITINDWEDLRPYSIVSMLGLKHTESKLTGYERVYFTRTIQKAFTLLDRRRYDITVFALFDGINMINALALKKIRALPFENIPSYHFINSKHRQVLPAITKALEHMKATGRLQHIAARFQKRLEEGYYYRISPSLDRIPIKSSAPQ